MFLCECILIEGVSCCAYGVGRQSQGVGFLCPLCGSQGLNSGCQALRQVLSIEPSYNNFIIFYSVCVPVCLYEQGYVRTSACGCHKRALGPLEPELQGVVSCPVGAGNRTQVFCKNSVSTL